MFVRFAVLSASIFYVTAVATPSLDKFGGTESVKGKATGFFHVEKQKTGGWQLIDPAGNGFFCAGMDMAGPDSQQAEKTLQLKEAGFNAFMGGDTSKTGRYPYARIVGSTGWRRNSTFKDVFSDSFEIVAKTRIFGSCTTSRNDPYLIGYYTDNELAWNMVWGGGYFDDYLNLSADSKGRAEAVSYAKKRYNTIGSFNNVWATSYASWDSVGAGNFKPVKGFNKKEAAACRDGFLYLVSKRYHSFLYTTFKAADPNHLVMGNRFLTGDIPMPVIRGMKGSVDVVSSNCYALRTFPSKTFRTFCDTIGAPFVITEYGYCGQDAGVLQDLPGAIPRLLATQQERADRFEWYVKHAAGEPYCIGTFWWYSKDGTRQHDRGNFGFWNKKGDKRYQILYDRAKAVNPILYDVRAKKAAPVDPTPPMYTIKKVTAKPLDGMIDPKDLDIVLDTSCRYEGFGFDTSGFHGLANVRNDGKNVIVSLRVYDRHLNLYTKKLLQDSTTRNMWEIDGMELRLGRYEALFYFDDSTLTYSWVSSDPFEGIVCKGTVMPDGYTMTIALPISELAEVISNNTILFAIGINDGERNVGRFRQLQWPQSFEWIYKESYARGKF